MLNLFESAKNRDEKQKRLEQVLEQNQDKKQSSIPCYALQQAAAILWLDERRWGEL